MNQIVCKEHEYVKVTLTTSVDDKEVSIVQCRFCGVLKSSTKNIEKYWDGIPYEKQLYNKLCEVRQQFNAQKYNKKLLDF